MTQQPKKIEFQEALMRERARYQVSRSDIAKHVGVGEREVRRWERGEAIPNNQQFKRLVSRLPRVAPFFPTWAGLGGAAVDGCVDDDREWNAGVIEKIIPVLDKYDKPESQEFGPGLARVREENEVTQEALGEILGVVGQAVSQWETGDALPVKENLLKLFEVLPELKAGMETGAIKRPKWSQDIAKPTGGRGFPRSPTVDTMLDMALAQSDEEIARQRTPRMRHENPQSFADTVRPHEHVFEAELKDVIVDGVNIPLHIVCSICGAPKPDSPRASEVRIIPEAHEHHVRRCPCGGDVSRPDGKMGPWVCARCLRRLWEQDLVDAGVAERSTVTELAEAYGRARVQQTRAEVTAARAQEAAAAATTEAERAKGEAAAALELLELAIEQESK